MTTKMVGKEINSHKMEREFPGSFIVDAEGIEDESQSLGRNA